MQMNKKNLTVFLLGEEIPELMAALGYEISESLNHIVFKKSIDPANRYRIVVKPFEIQCNVWNDNHNEERWHETLRLELPSYRFAAIGLQEWALILHLGKQIEFRELAAKCGLKIQEENVCAA